MQRTVNRHAMGTWLVSWVCLGLVALTCPAATHYVVPPGTPGVTPTDPYTSWATAGTNLDLVVTAAQTHTEPRLVLVTNGTYYLTGAIDITKAITVKGVNGYTNTIINGNAPAYTNYAFYINIPSGQTGILDGLTITNCWNSGVRLGARAVVRNCMIVGCANIIAGLTGSRSGGGLLTDANTSPITITNCIVRGNTATTYGGGIYASFGNSGILIVDTLVEHNKLIGTEGGGGIAINNTANAVIKRCTIRHNDGRRNGGGIWLFGGSGNCSIIDCTIASNKVNLVGATGGGGIASRSTASFLASGCLIQGNTTTAGKGGGVYAEGTSARLRSCLVSGNTAQLDGGGIWCGAGIMENCTIITNQAGVGGTGVGGGIYMNAADGVVTGINNIVYFNTADAADNFTNAQGNVNLSYSCVFPAVSGTENTTKNPLLVSLAGGDYRLGRGSPCINSGIYRAWMANAVDLAGRERILEGVVDMGAYETLPPSGTVFSVR